MARRSQPQPGWIGECFERAGELDGLGFGERGGGQRRAALLGRLDIHGMLPSDKRLLEALRQVEWELVPQRT